MTRTISVVAVAVVAALLAAAGSASASDSAAKKRDVDCSDFSTQAQAQSYFINHGGPGSDPNGLDADGDGIACESNPCPCSTSTGGGGGGGGGNPAPPPEPKIVKKKLCGKFVGIPRSRVCFTAVVKGKKLKKVKRFKFKRLPARCASGREVVVNGKDRKIDGDGKRFRSPHPELLGRYTNVHGQIQGRVSGKGKKGKGTVRVAFKSNGVNCTTRARKWKVS